jgi:hypothetical protein
MLRVAGCLLAIVTAAATPTFAHHSFALFDMDKNVTMVGSVIEYRWVESARPVVLKVDPSADVPSDRPARGILRPPAARTS